MGRSFGIVECKVTEAHFFIQKLEEASEDFSLLSARCYISAFVAAARSITFTLKSSISDVPKFKEWYEKHEGALRTNSLARYFLFARNESQKVGYYPINGMGSTKDNGREKAIFHFDNYYPELKEEIPQADAISACKEYFRLLLNVIYDCFIVFGSIIDPDQYYTIENIKLLGKSIEDIEEEIGLPRGWTGMSGGTDEQRIDAIRGQFSTNSIDPIFIEYLNKDRFGNTYEESTGS